MDRVIKIGKTYRHFKGNMYKVLDIVYDSEESNDKEYKKVVIYQALYGEEAYWVRPEKMFFEQITRDGRTFNRFTEIDR